jgi:RNA-directed DNA polymerase
MPVKIIGMIGVTPPSNKASLHVIEGGLSPSYLTEFARAHVAPGSTWCWWAIRPRPQKVFCAVISPIPANVYLHYVFDLWAHRWRLTKASGDMIVIRYADDTIVGFQHEHEARAFLDDLKERMRKFELALHPDKTRLIRFGRHATKQREKLGEGKPETFDFLGFTHFCTRSRKWGSFVIGRKTIKKRMRAKLLAVKIELRRKMHDPIAKTGAWVKQMLKGHLNYFAVSGNHPSLWWFFNKLKRLWLASLKRRSQTARLSWEKFTRLVARFFPPIRTLHPLPCHRFDARTRGRRSYAGATGYRFVGNHIPKHRRA